MTIQQHNPPHPGALIQRTYVEPFSGVTGNKVADCLGVAHSTFYRLLNGVSDISTEIVVRLSGVLGGSAESRLMLQDSFNLWKAHQKVDIKKFERIDFNKVA